MVNRRIVVALAAIGTMAAANIIGTGCVKSDDGDTFATPTPPPVPTPQPGTHCQVAWTADDPDAPGTFHAWIVDGDISLWVSPTASFGTAGFLGIHASGVAADANGAAGTVEALTNTAGDFGLTLSINGVADGASLGISSGATAPTFGLDTAGNPDFSAPTGNEHGMTFDGAFTAKGSTTFDLGSGTATLLVGTNNESVGAGGAFAICYDIPAAFAPQSRAQAALAPVKAFVKARAQQH